MMLFGQQVPGVEAVLQVFSTGQHCIQVKSTLTPRNVLIEMMMNHTSNFIHRSDDSRVIRSRVSAKDVLLQAAAMIENDPERLA